jgi:hypothetical protein
VLLDRAGRRPTAPGAGRPETPVIASLAELPELLGLPG